MSTYRPYWGDDDRLDDRDEDDDDEAWRGEPEEEAPPAEPPAPGPSVLKAGGVVLALLLGGWLLLQWLGSTGRVLHVVNGTRLTAQVTVRRGDRIVLTRAAPSHERTSLSLGEGDYEVELVTPRGKDRIAVKLRSSPGARTGDARTVFVINVDGAGLLLRESAPFVPVIESRDPIPRGGAEHRYQLLFGNTLEVCDEVHYPFCDWGIVHHRDTDRSIRYRTRLTALASGPRRALIDIPDAVPMERIAAWLEHLLRLDPADAEARDTYAGLILDTQTAERRRAFLSALPPAGPAPR